MQAENTSHYDISDYGWYLCFWIEWCLSYHLQVEQLEKQQILEFETHLAAASKMTITEHNSLLIAQLTTMNPR